MTNRKVLGLILILVTLCLLAAECQEISIESTTYNVPTASDLPSMTFNLQVDDQQPGPQPTEIIFVKLLDASHIQCVSGLPAETESVFEPLAWDINLINPPGVVVRLKIMADGRSIFVSEEGQEYGLETAVRFSATNRHWTCPDAQPVTVIGLSQ